jgi:ABC-type Fe3+ transport system permease subunit
MARWIGFAALAASGGVVVVWTAAEALGGPVADQAIWPTPRMLSCLATSLKMALLATVIAHLIAVPVVFGMVVARRVWQKRLLTALIILPLVTMPSIFAYAWMLLATRRDGWIAAALDALGWNEPGRQTMQAAWVLATWLWPIPALLIAAAFEREGRRGYRLARLDASAPVAFLRGALPLMRGPLWVGAAVTFVLAVNDGSIPPLMGATRVWPVELMASAGVAMGQDRPAGFLFWTAWPMLVLTIFAAASAAPGVMRMAAWADVDADGGTTTTEGRGGLAAWCSACAIAAAMGVFPFVVFASELAVGRSPFVETISAAFQTLRSDGMATLVVAAASAALALCIGLAVLSHRQDAPWRRAAAGIAVVTCLLLAVSPPELIGTALAAFFSRISDPAGLNLYDRTPWAWIAAVLCRYAALGAAIACVTCRRTPTSLIDQARSDGAGPTARSAHVLWPFVSAPLFAAAMMVGCLAFCELAASVIVQPTQFVGGPLAVRVDAQMHYGRSDQTVAVSLLFAAPPMLAAALSPLLTRRRTPPIK